MKDIDPKILRKLYIPSPVSHKGDNGKLLIIAGSQLFHSASLWPLTVASRIVDMVFFSSVPTNNEIVTARKKETMTRESSQVHFSKNILRKNGS